MRRLSRVPASTGLVMILCTGLAAAQFNPGGRRSGQQPATAKAPAARPTPRPAPGAKPRPAPSAPAPSTPGPTSAAAEGERDAQLLERYQALALSHPGEEVPLRRLIELSQKTDGDLQKLKAQFQKLQTSPQTHRSATILLARLHLFEKQPEAAKSALLPLSESAPKELLVWQTLLRVADAQNDRASGEIYLKKIVALAAGIDRDIALRDLRDRRLSQGDYRGAETYQRLLNKGVQGHHVRAELGRELLKRGQAERAVTEFTRLKQESAGDSRALVPALIDLGEAQIASGDPKGAIENLTRASALSGRSPGLRLRALTLLASAHQADGTLPVLIARLEKDAKGDGELLVLARLLEAQGETERAINAYQRALKTAPKDVDARLNLIRLYELSGDLTRASQEMSRLVKEAPRAVDLSLRLMEMQLSLGERRLCLAEFDRIERATTSDPDAALLLLDFAQRLGESTRAARIIQTQRSSGRLDSRHLAELGGRLFRAGDTSGARALWAKMVTHPPKAADLIAHGNVLILHGRSVEGVAELKRAVDLDPHDARSQKALGQGLLRAAAEAPDAQKRELETAAARAFESVWQSAKQDPQGAAVRADMRRKLARLYRRLGSLPQKLAQAERAFRGSPPDLEAGLFLAEGQEVLGRKEASLLVLKKVTELSPKDADALKLLEKTQARAGDHLAAIQTLKQLIEADPARRGHYYEQMASHALVLKRDEEAAEYAELAAKLDAADPAAQERLGHLYQKLGRLPDAERAYRLALEKDRDNHEVALTLATLLAQRGKDGEALELSLRSLRGSRDDEMLLKAGRLAKSIAEHSGRLAEVEGALGPLISGDPERDVYRSLYMETVQLRIGEILRRGAQRPGADPELVELSRRALTTLLLILSRDDLEHERVAIELLGYGSEPAAGKALLYFAKAKAHGPLAVSALLSAARLENPDLSPLFSEFLENTDASRRGPLPRAAALALSLLPPEASGRARLRALGHEDPAVRAEAARGALGLLGSAAFSKPTTQSLLRLVNDPNETALVRSVASLSLGYAPEGKETTQVLSELARTGTGDVRAAALIGLANRDPQSALALVPLAFTSSDPEYKTAAVLAAVQAVEGAPQPQLQSESRRRVRAGEAALDLQLLLADELDRDVSAAARLEAFLRVAEPFSVAALQKLKTSQESAESIVVSLTGPELPVTLTPLYPPRDLGKVDAHLVERTRAVAEELRQTLAPSLLQVSSWAEEPLKARALSLLRLTDGPEANALITVSLESARTPLFEAALSALTQTAPLELSLSALDNLLLKEPAWNRKRRIVSAILDMAPRFTQAEQSHARELLSGLANDPTALVSQHAKEALAELTP